ncbi:helix-turn-helix domain-containing protein [Arthrobacter sp. NA-172]|uniref:helix-turn-helix domain-containing protein n=1 Tax=Arthrobacter sp. NA-172 TaxID=3367524 RepID=UPI0037547903
MVDETAEQLGEHFKQWRIVLGLSQELAADRANLSMPTLRRIERGDTGVRLGSVLALMEVLNLTEQFIQSSDPLSTDLGRARAHLLGRQRARRSQ